MWCVVYTRYCSIWFLSLIAGLSERTGVREQNNNLHVHFKHQLVQACAPRFDAGSTTADYNYHNTMALPLRSLPRIISCPSTPASALGINIDRLASRRANLNIILTRSIASSANCRPHHVRDEAVPTSHHRQAGPVGRAAVLRQMIVQWKLRQHRAFYAEAANTTAGNGPLPLFGDDVIVTKRCAEVRYPVTYCKLTVCAESTGTVLD